MKNIKNKISEIINKKYFIPIFVILLNTVFFILFNIFLQPRYETIDDFIMMKIISKLDGNYSIYGIFIHPALCTIIMMLYKTGINVNWYSIFFFIMQFISFTVIGITLMKNNKKYGLIYYFIIIFTIYPRILLSMNFTSTATIIMASGFVILMCEKNKKTMALGYLLILIGVMLRWKTIIFTFPFYIIYSFYYMLFEKKYKYICRAAIAFIIIVFVYLSNSIIYNLDETNKNYLKFNSIRSYFFDLNILDYDENKELFNEIGWSKNDYELFYSYSFCDIEFYNTETLTNLKSKISNTKEMHINKVYNAIKDSFYKNILEYPALFIVIILLIQLSVLNKKNTIINILYLILYFIINIMLCYSKCAYRVLISLYLSTIIMMSCVLIKTKNTNKNILFTRIIIPSMIFITILINSILYVKEYKTLSIIKKYDYSHIREIINYTNQHKENLYLYPNILGNISSFYSVYEKIEDNTFYNLQVMGDWDIYNRNYCIINENYDVNNPMKDLYCKDNIFLIDGDVVGGNNKIYSNHIDIVIKYIQEHYKIDVKYKIVKEFEKNNIKVYKLYEDI